MFCYTVAVLKEKKRQNIHMKISLFAHLQVWNTEKCQLHSVRMYFKKPTEQKIFEE